MTVFWEKFFIESVNNSKNWLFHIFLFVSLQWSFQLNVIYNFYKPLIPMEPNFIISYNLNFLFSFFSESFFLLSRRFSTFARLGLVAILFFGTMSDLFTNSWIFSIAIFLFWSWVLLSETVNWRIPSKLILFFNFKAILSFSKSVNTAESSNFYITVTEVSTLFTFCPPLPLLREVL